MDLIQVDVICSEAAQAVIDGAQDVLARQSLIVWVVTHALEDFGSDHNLIASACEILQRTSQDLFTDANRVYVGSVIKVNA